MAAWLPLPSGFTGYATRFVVCHFSPLWHFLSEATESEAPDYRLIMAFML